MAEEETTELTTDDLDYEGLAYGFLTDGLKFLRPFCDPASADFDAKMAGDVSLRASAILTGLHAARGEFATALAILGEVGEEE